MSAAALAVLADASLRAALVAGLVAAAVAALRVRAGAARHAAWTVVLAAMLLMPALARLVPAVDVPMPALARFVAAIGVPIMPAPARPVPAADVPIMPAPARPVPAADVPMPGAARGGAAAALTQTPPPLAGPAPATPASAAAAPPHQAVAAARDPVPPEVPPESPRRARSWTPVALGAYLAGVAVMLLRLALGLWGSRRLVLGARRVDGSTRRRLGALPARVRESDRIAVPVTVDLFRSTVGLPTGWERWPDAALQPEQLPGGCPARQRLPRTRRAARPRIGADSDHGRGPRCERAKPRRVATRPRRGPSRAVRRAGRAARRRALRSDGPGRGGRADGRPRSRAVRRPQLGRLHRGEDGQRGTLRPRSARPRAPLHGNAGCRVVHLPSAHDALVAGHASTATPAPPSMRSGAPRRHPRPRA